MSDGAPRWERERRARIEAEQIAEDATRRLYDALQEVQRLNTRLARWNEDLTNEVERQTEALRRANGALDSFAASIAHDLKSPLSTFNLSLKTLRNRMAVNDEMATRQLVRMGETVERMSSMIGALLNSARGESIQDSSCVLVNPLFDAVLEQISDAHHIHRFDTEPVEPLMANPILLRQVLENLVSNAIKYRGPQPLHLRLTPATGAAGFRLIDNGPGLGDNPDSLFTQFVRADERAIGHGIGLATCRRIVNRMGGEITASNNPDGGACFTVILPSART